MLDTKKTLEQIISKERLTDAIIATYENVAKQDPTIILMSSNAIAKIFLAGMHFGVNAVHESSVKIREEKLPETGVSP